MNDMKPFEELTARGQVGRLRRLAQSALKSYGFRARLKFIAQHENTTFRVDAVEEAQGQAGDGVYVPNRYLLRVHRPGYQTAASIASELAWLSALRYETGLVVPEPVPTPDGEFLVEATAPGVPEPRACSLLRWVRGRLPRQRLRPTHFLALGKLMAALHEHTAYWCPPTGFVRRHWDWEGLFGDDAGFNLPAREVWARLPEPQAGSFKRVTDQARQVMEELGEGPDVFGLIHADLLLGQDGNVLFSAGEARPVDFDDCGFGYWVYDLAVALCHWQESNTWPTIRFALLDGYAQVRPLPEEWLAHLDLFMAARHVSEILWAVDMAQVNPHFREMLDEWMAWAAMHVERFL